MTTAVAKTTETGVIDPTAVTEIVVIAAPAPGFVWNTLITVLGPPVRASHSLIGLIGASVA